MAVADFEGKTLNEGCEKSGMNNLVTALLPSLSRSLSETFNIFRVMHHGTHEKQLSNIFAWLLTPDETHGLGDKFQKAFIKRVNDRVHSGDHLPLAGYHVVQEVDTRTGEDVDATEGMDIADIVLWRTDAALIIENYGTSDGHGHSYQQYLAHGSARGRRAVVVLLCHRHESHLQRDGWELATVVTYPEVLSDLKAEVDNDPAWRREHAEQLFFVNQMYQQFVKGPEAVNVTDQVSFIKTMCETGESARYGYRPHDRTTQEFADLVAAHARKQFDDSRLTLTKVKGRLRSFVRSVLVEQVNDAIESGRVEKVSTRYVGKWEWRIKLERADSQPSIFLEFGPTAVVENARAEEAIDDPDYSQIFVALHDPEADGIARIAQTEISLAEVIAGLARDDSRLRDAVLSLERHGL